MNKYLMKHQFPDDLKNMDIDELELLSYEIRDFLVEEVSKTYCRNGGNVHLISIIIS